VKTPQVQVYVEGGGPARGGDLATECRRAFGALLEKAIGRRVGITACGGRYQTYDAFATAVSQRKYDVAILLVDSEELVGARDPWEHLRARDRWQPVPAPAHLMVVCTEAWLLADHDALRAHFGAAFDDGKIPKWPRLWEVSKEGLYMALKDSTKSRRGGPYDKGRDSFKVLALVDPRRVESCPHARSFFEDLRRCAAIPG
jgi:hypothetical protein